MTKANIGMHKAFGVALTSIQSKLSELLSIQGLVILQLDCSKSIFIDQGILHFFLFLFFVIFILIKDPESGYKYI